MGPDHLFQALLAEHLSAFRTHLPDAVGANQHDLFQMEAARILLILEMVIQAEGQPAAFELVEPIHLGIVEQGGLVPRPHPADLPLSGRQLAVEEGHEIASIVSVQAEVAVHIPHDAGRRPRQCGSLHHQSAGRGHEQCGGDAVARHIPHHHGQAIFGDGQEIEVVSAGLLAVEAGAGDVEAGQTGIFTGQ